MENAGSQLGEVQRDVGKLGHGRDYFLSAVARQRPPQERFLMPPSFEAQIWQWPVTTLNPLNTNMYMFTIHQELPGRGKRDLRAAVAEKDVELASVDIAMRARDVVKDVMRVYADLAVARRASTFTSRALNSCGSSPTRRRSSTPPGAARNRTC